MKRRQTRAVNRIKLAWRRHKARERLHTQELLSAFGACNFCWAAKARVYLEHTEQKLCRQCYHRTISIIHSKGRIPQGRFYEIADYRQLADAAWTIQIRYRAFVRWKRAKYGTCKFCPRAVRLYCMSCEESTCHTCAHVVHAVKILSKHKRIGIETYRRQKKAAAILCRFFRRYREKARLYRKFGSNLFKRKNFGCTCLQRIWRGYYCR